jgi:HK97 family phage prohead protease
MKHKTVEIIECKADEADAKPGWFSALVSAFGNVDHVGDRMVKGAFAKTLERWREGGKAIPVVWSHDWGDPFALIGQADPRAVMENDKGLLVQGQLDLENPKAKQVHKLMKNGLLESFSFGYTVPDGGEKSAEDGVNEVYEVDLVEIGPTLKGANPEARLQEVKSVNENPAADHIEVKGAGSVGPKARAQLAGLIEYYMKKPHPFTSCVRDNTKRFGKERAERICATLKDIGMGTTRWREGRSLDAEVKAEERDFVQELYDAAEGDVDGLMGMWEDHMARNGDKSYNGNDEASDEPRGQARPSDPLRKRADEVALSIGTRDLNPHVRPDPPPKPPELLPLKELRKRMREAELTTLIGRQDQ